jgi:hypothetical protein
LCIRQPVGIGLGHNHPVVVTPAWTWRGGPAFSALGAGLPVGFFFGALGFAESGSVVALLALIVLGPLVYGIPMARRMTRFWPEAKMVSGADRVAVVRASRRGEDIGEARLAHAVIDYGSGLRAASAQARRFWVVVPVVAAVSLILAVTDSVFGPIRLALVSWLWVALVLIEMFWWPRRLTCLLANTARADDLARQLIANG